jgi:hypothetical protein
MRIDHMLSVVWATATNAMSETTTVDASLLDMRHEKRGASRKDRTPEDREPADPSREAACSP